MGLIARWRGSELRHDFVATTLKLWQDLAVMLELITYGHRLRISSRFDLKFDATSFMYQGSRLA